MSEETYIDYDGSELWVRRYNGVVQYFNPQGQWHRLDGPAVVYTDGDKFWRVDGKKVEPLFLVAYWLERGRCCWFDEETQNLCFSDS